MPDTSLRVGIIGFGFIGKVHAHAYLSVPFCYQQPGPKPVVAALLRHAPGGESELKRALGNPFETTDPEAFFAQDLDLVDVCSPNDLHAQHVLAALTRKLPVYCEKPLALDLPQSRECAQAAAQAGVLTHTAFTMRYIPAVWQAKAIIASGALGEIYNFRAHFFHNSYMDASRPMSWRMRTKTSGGGSLADLGIHIIDMARHLMGDAEWVSCQTRTFIKNRPISAGSAETEPVDVDDWALCQLGLANGAPGSIEVTRMSGGAGESCRFEIFGSLGSVEIDLSQTALVRWYDHRSKRITFGSADLPVPAGERAIGDWLPHAKLSLGWFRDAHTGCIQDFLIDLAEGKPSSADFSAALKAQEILTAAYRSASQDGARVNLPLP